jgi:hypothetical protein
MVRARGNFPETLYGRLTENTTVPISHNIYMVMMSLVRGFVRILGGTNTILQQIYPVISATCIFNLSYILSRSLCTGK